MLAMIDTYPGPVETKKAEISLAAADSELDLIASIWKRNNRKPNKRRFNDEQIRLLESMFATESRPELQMKHQLANELGLHPRQIAIWFQNRRARTKSKLIEQEYNILKSSYDTLAIKFDCLKKEKQRLFVQLQKLRNATGRRQEPGKCSDEECEKTDTHRKVEKKPNSVVDCNQCNNGVLLCCDSSANLEYVREEADIPKMAELIDDGSFTSSGYWGSFGLNFESSGVLDHPSCSSDWWNV